MAATLAQLGPARRRRGLLPRPDRARRVNRLLPPGRYREITFPRGTGPGVRELGRLRRRLATGATPPPSPPGSRRMSAPAHQIWLVWAPGYQTFGTKCEQTRGGPARRPSPSAPHEMFPYGQVSTPGSPTRAWSWCASSSRLTAVAAQVAGPACRHSRHERWSAPDVEIRVEVRHGSRPRSVGGVSVVWLVMAGPRTRRKLPGLFSAGAGGLAHRSPVGSGGLYRSDGLVRSTASTALLQPRRRDVARPGATCLRTGGDERWRLKSERRRVG